MTLLFRFSVRDIQFSPQPCKAPQASSHVSSQFLSLKYVFLHHSTKKDFLKVIANFFPPNSVIYLPPVLYEAFYTVSQALSTCSLAFCPIVMLSLDVLLKFSCFFTGLSVLLVSCLKVFVNLSFITLYFLGRIAKLLTIPYMNLTIFYSIYQFQCFHMKEEKNTYYELAVM